jgi:hypothetical protein
MGQRFSLDDNYPASKTATRALSRAAPRITVSHDLTCRSDGILALAAPFHTHYEHTARILGTVAEWQL